MHNTRSANLNVEPFDSEIERTLHRLRRTKDGQIVIVEPSDSEELHSDTESSESSVELDEMAGTIKQLTAPNLTNQPLCITFPPLGEDATFELKSGLIHLLPTFHGLSTEDPNKHLSDFHIVCSSMKTANVTDEQLKLRAFPFSLKDAAKDWLYYLPENSINTWLSMKQAFLSKYFPASRASQLKKEISNVEQRDGETLYEYWERFKRLCATCPYHGYADQDLIMYFCGGLGQDDARMIHAASGGIVNKSPTEAKALIAELAESSRVFERHPTRRGVNQVGSSQMLEEKVDSLTSLVRDLVIGKQPASVCRICSSDGHVTQQCPGMYEEQSAEVNAAGYMEPPQRKYDPYSNTYNSRWKDHPNFRWGNQQGNQRPPQSNQQGPPNYYFQKSQGQNYTGPPPNANRELIPAQSNPNRNIVNAPPQNTCNIPDFNDLTKHWQKIN
ncbi:hypothetical protein RND81_08G071100 [Saponaria officinalis]|uniref:Retrotransposon gag domain-containing protein n=1 Tax=Saponaria officinalis TaxID=3572 RepID=A0AAW1J5Q2_SAPOF